jgi:hydroxyethylthiazole kinase-like uncharacterized protein yjeF
MTAAETRAAEQALFDRGVPVIDLMERAGGAVADIIRDHFAPAETLILAGPGNNGGDGYVVARRLREAGWKARVAATGEPKSETARLARARCDGPVEDIADAPPAAILVDALFGTGLMRPLAEGLQRRLMELVDAADHAVAVDLPSGVATDDGALLGEAPTFDLTVALGVLKPAHVGGDGAERCGRVVTADIGLFDPPEGSG